MSPVPVSCPRCDSRSVVFPVPDSLREHAPDGESAASICPDCLTLAPVEGTDAEVPDAAEFDRLPFPSGEGGAAVALAVGNLESLALNRPSIEACVEHAERSGADVFLALDRLADATVNPAFDPARRRAQLENLL
ncbi:MAG: DUF6276 family protein [Haloferacaceae archaeon]